MLSRLPLATPKSAPVSSVRSVMNASTQGSILVGQFYWIFTVRQPRQQQVATPKGGKNSLKSASILALKTRSPTRDARTCSVNCLHPIHLRPFFLLLELD